MIEFESKIGQALYLKRDSEKAKFLAGFFKTGPGEYAEGDQFLGVQVPEVRKLIPKFKKITSEEDMLYLIKSPWHEARLLGLLLLVEKIKHDPGGDTWPKIYLQNLKYVNNWDLVDVTAPKALGEYFRKREKSELFRLALSSDLWENRIAILTTMAFVKNQDYETTLKLAEKFLTHPHDLIHKASGWLLREVGKKNKSVLLDFLNKFHSKMPRTMLRYAIEKFPEIERKNWMSK